MIIHATRRQTGEMSGAVVLFCLLLSLASGEVLHAALDHRQDLATRIRCQVEEAQHFRYSSVTELWGTMGGEIHISADLILYCLGDDNGGSYGSEALKYVVQIENLLTSEHSGRRRRKRGATKDFFSSAWKKVKQFVGRVFGRNPQSAEEARAATPADDTEEAFAASLYSKPFQLVQWANGTIPEIRFSEDEVEDSRVRNFKRHLADAFSTQLNFNPKREEIVEKSVIGEHTSTYNITTTGRKANLKAAGPTSLPHEQDSETVVVNKVVTHNDIVQLAPSDALNDKDGMNLRTHQVQVFQGGRMISSRGDSRLSLATDSSSEGGGGRRRKRSDEEDATSYIRTHSSFDIQMRRRIRRSVGEQEAGRLHNTFRPASRTAEVDDTYERGRLRHLQESVDFELIVKDFMGGQVAENDQTIESLVEQEVTLQLDQEEKSMSNIIRRAVSSEEMEILCSKNFSSCKELLQLSAMAGGDDIEKMFVHLLMCRLRTSELQSIADIVSDVRRPSPELLAALGDLLERMELDPMVTGTLCLSLGHLATRGGEEAKNRTADLLSRHLAEKSGACSKDPLTIDLLEAVGNLKSDRITSRVLQVSAGCKTDSVIQIACAHALRHTLHTSSARTWIEKMIAGGECDVIKEVVGSLLDKVQDQEVAQVTSHWPRYHFNHIDELLRNFLEERKCCAEDIIRYFGRKKDAEANLIAQQRFRPESSLRMKRALWDDLNCEEWTEDNRYRPIQSRDEFTMDRETYNRRKSCLAYRKLGVKGANAEIYAGMFAGLKEPSKPLQYKLFTKFVSGFNFLGRHVELGSFYFYLHSGRTKAYVRVMGRTRQEFTHEGCTPTDLQYRPTKHIPLYVVSIGNVQMSLGIHLSSRLAIDTVCPDANVYQLQPLTDVRIGGEASGTVLFVRGAANLGANFNYKLQFTFTPSPDMCLKGSHGFDPMNINFESYFQLWNSAKQDWGKMRVWKPNFMTWRISRGELKQWFDDACIASRNGSDAFSERELE